MRQFKRNLNSWNQLRVSRFQFLFFWLDLEWEFKWKNVSSLTCRGLETIKITEDVKFLYVYLHIVFPMKLYRAATVDVHNVLIAWDKYAHASFNWIKCLKFSPASKHVRQISRMFSILSMQPIRVWKSKCCLALYF